MKKLDFNYEAGNFNFMKNTTWNSLQTAASNRYGHSSLSATKFIESEQT